MFYSLVWWQLASWWDALLAFLCLSCAPDRNKTSEDAVMRTGKLLTWPAPSRHPHPLLLADSDLITLSASHLSHNWLWGAWVKLGIPTNNEQGIYDKTVLWAKEEGAQEIAPFCSLRSTLGLAASIVWNNLLISWVFIVWVVICGAGLLTNFPFSL